MANDPCQGQGALPATDRRNEDQRPELGREALEDARHAYGTAPHFADHRETLEPLYREATESS